MRKESKHLSSQTQIREYRIDRLIGEGCTGDVYLAHHDKTHREVAIRVVSASLMQNRSVRRGFIVDGQVMTALEHPNIVRLLEIHEEGGHFFLLMEYVDGASLDQVIQNSPLPLGVAIHVAQSVLSALGDAHSREPLPIVHRDIKAGNVLLDRLGRVKIADYGIAKVLDKETLIGSGELLGTYEYMSPEQIRGEQCGPEADLYSTAVLLYHMVTGHVPFPDLTPQGNEAKEGHLHKAPPRLDSFRSDLPTALQDVIARALEKNPQERFASAEEFSEVLSKVLQSSEESEDEGALTPVNNRILEMETANVVSATLLETAKTEWDAEKGYLVKALSDLKEEATRREAELGSKLETLMSERSAAEDELQKSEQDWQRERTKLVKARDDAAIANIDLSENLRKAQDAAAAAPEDADSMDSVLAAERELFKSMEAQVSALEREVSERDEALRAATKTSTTSYGWRRAILWGGVGAGTAAMLILLFWWAPWRDNHTEDTICSAEPAAQETAQTKSVDSESPLETTKPSVNQAPTPNPTPPEARPDAESAEDLVRSSIVDITTSELRDDVIEEPPADAVMDVVRETTDPQDLEHVEVLDILDAHEESLHSDLREEKHASADADERPNHREDQGRDADAERRRIAAEEEEHRKKDKAAALAAAKKSEALKKVARAETALDKKNFQLCIALMTEAKELDPANRKASSLLKECKNKKALLDMKF